MQENHRPVPVSSMAPARQKRAVAVALKADETNPDAPAQIVASGRGDMANKILDIAFRHGVKVREDQDLAELLVQLDLDTPIPSEAIVAVAEILAKVYEANEAALAPNPFSNAKGFP